MGSGQGELSVWHAASRAGGGGLVAASEIAGTINPNGSTFRTTSIPILLPSLPEPLKSSFRPECEEPLQLEGDSGCPLNCSTF